MATHSRILAWRTPWTVEPGGQATVRGVAKSQTLSDQHFHFLSELTLAVLSSQQLTVKGLSRQA